jgi:hypothetical protein
MQKEYIGHLIISDERIKMLKRGGELGFSKN